MMGWDKNHGEAAVGGLSGHERALLFRIAEARGRRVSVKELSSTLGLPPSTSLTRDFPALLAYVDRCKEKDDSLEVPVVACSEGDGGWYWMSAEHAELVFLPALSAEPSVAAADQQAGSPQ
jgi:hypothetical protein